MGDHPSLTGARRLGAAAPSKAEYRLYCSSAVQCKSALKNSAEKEQCRIVQNSAEHNACQWQTVCAALRPCSALSCVSVC